MAHEHIDPELVLQRSDLLGNPRLRGMQGIRGLGHVEAATGDLGQVAQLLQLHIAKTFI